MATTYDPKKYDVILAGVRINEGLADGTWLTVTPEVQGFSKKVGADGKATRTRMSNRSGTVTLTLMQTSLINDILSGLYNADLQATNGEGTATLKIQDRAGNTSFLARSAWVANDPDISLDVEASTREWSIDYEEALPTHGGTPDL